MGTKTFKNWYKQGYLGYSNIRDGIIYSMNIVAVRTMMETVSPQLGVEYAKNFGITTLTDTDMNAATALGGITKGVTNLELTAAYASIANGGLYTKPIFFTKILDHDGKLLIDNEPETHRVLKDSTAFLLTDAMEDSMQANRIFASSGVSVSSTSTRAPQRRLMFSRGMSAGPPSQWTRPFSARTFFRSSRRSSSATRASSPKRQGMVYFMGVPPWRGIQMPVDFHWSRWKRGSQGAAWPSVLRSTRMV